MNESIFRRKLFIVTISLILLAVFSPYMIAYQSVNRIIITASIWSIIVIENNWMLIIPPLIGLLIAFVILIPRLLYVYTLWGYYTKRNRKGDFFWAVIFILAQLLIPCIYYYFNPFYILFPIENGPIIIRPGATVGDLICIPIPILLCAGLILLGYWRPHLEF